MFGPGRFQFGRRIPVKDAAQNQPGTEALHGCEPLTLSAGGQRRTVTLSMLMDPDLEDRDQFSAQRPG